MAWVCSSLRLARTLVVCSAMAALLGGPAPADEPPILWRTDVAQALSDAQSQQRPVWLQFTGRWCHFCRRMESEVFPVGPVAALARSPYMPIRVDADEAAELMARHAVTKLPATILLDASGFEIARVQGFRSADQFLAFLQEGQRLVAASARPALGGKCPVSLVQDNVLVAGQDAVWCIYESKRFCFRDASSRDLFLLHPERFAPAQGGQCVVSLQDERLQVPGDPRFGVYYRSRLYLCQDEAHRRAFARDPERYAAGDSPDGGPDPAAVLASPIGQASLGRDAHARR